MIDSDGNTVAPYRPAPPTCRNGHVKTAANTYRSKSGHDRCRDCRRKHKPLKDRPCVSCKTIFAGQGKRCPACVAIRHMTALEEATAPIRTRMCAECLEVYPLEQFLLLAAGGLRKGVKQYSDQCQDCRDEGDGGDGGAATSPYERAKRQVVRIFGVPSQEWMNRSGHVLSDLHFLRMLAIQHAEARRTGQKLTRADIVTQSRLLWPRLREFLHRSPSTFQLSRAA